MTVRRSIGLGAAAVGAVLVLALLALVVALVVRAVVAGHPGDLNITNDSDEAVTVSTGDDEVEVTAQGAVSILDHGCTAGDVTLTFPDRDPVVVDGPVCPADTIVVHEDGRVGLDPGPAARTPGPSGG
ncbi:hypothetical protein [Cellulomonas sp. PhB143]|uniref:hypothetical protein n=1 Tax=Cellulomonas sp. PhB143 TaxID=2485186 RepID=UPI000F47B6A6|nr:hypothetical protein [Cellulomonas sp. PhB143]ROS75410.1 hypothetical protein EDF32_1819 [Cellulomonas sp. PhB143]